MTKAMWKELGLEYDKECKCWWHPEYTTLSFESSETLAWVVRKIVIKVEERGRWIGKNSILTPIKQTLQALGL